MKTHHWIVFIIAIFILGGFLLWPKISNHNVDTGDVLTGTWHAGITNAEGIEWTMDYTFKTDGTYTVTTSDPYSEEGTYIITNEYLDGSIELTKTYDDGQKTYDMILTPGSEPDSLVLEGVVLTRQ